MQKPILVPGFLLVCFTHFAPAAAIAKPPVLPQFNVSITGLDQELEWSGQGPFQAGQLPQSPQVSMTVAGNDLRLELLIKTDILEIETVTTGSGDTQQVLQLPRKTRIETRCAVAVKEKCVVGPQDKPIAVVKRIR